MSKPLEKIYGNGFFRSRDKYSWRAPIAAAIIQYIFPDARSTIDVGAAIGDLTEAFTKLGLSACAIEGSAACIPYLKCSSSQMIIADIGQPLSEEVNQRLEEFAPDGRFDMLTCYEVLEHVEPECADALCDNLCALSDKLVTSACPPSTRMGRSGSVHHVNEQEAEYWESMFADRGYYRYNTVKHGRQINVETMFKNCLAPFSHKYGLKAWVENHLYFEKRR